MTNSSSNSNNSRRRLSIRSLSSSSSNAEITMTMMSSTTATTTANFRNTSVLLGSFVVVVLLLSLTFPTTSSTSSSVVVDAFVCTSTTIPTRSRSTTSTLLSPLYYSTKDISMPDIESMKATEMKHELESYGINTKTMFDKHDFERALLQARRDYEQMLKDCMMSTSSKKESSKKKKTYTYDRTNPSHFHEQERMWDLGSNDYQGSGFSHPPPPHDPFVGGPFPDMSSVSSPYEQDVIVVEDDDEDIDTDAYREGHDDPFAYARGDTQRQRQQRKRQQQQQQRNSHHAGVGVGGRRPHRGIGIETDPLFDHEAQYAYRGPNGRRRANFDSVIMEDEHYQDPYSGVGGESRRRRYHPSDDDTVRPPPNPRRNSCQEPQYNDPAIQMKYHEAFQKSTKMKVSELQRELNIRGISTKYCMVLADFCIEYSKAIAEEILPILETKQEEQQEKESSSLFDDDDDYDPTYRDVVMEPYDPNKFF